MAPPKAVYHGQCTHGICRTYSFGVRSRQQDKAHGTAAIPAYATAAQQLLVLTTLEQPMRNITSEAEAGNMARTTRQEPISRMPPPRPSPYHCMPPPRPPGALDHQLMPPPQQPPMPYRPRSWSDRGERSLIHPTMKFKSRCSLIHRMMSHFRRILLP